MPFHKTSLGLLGERLPCDLHGYVPQDGDSWEEFTWEPRTEWTPASWSLFVEQAVQATQQAEEATLRTQGDPGRALVAEAAAIAERAWEDSCQDDRELLSAVCALHRHAERVAFLLSRRPQADASALELASLLSRTRTLLTTLERTIRGHHTN